MSAPRFLPHLPEETLAARQLAGVRRTVDQAMRNPVYRARFAAVGITSGADIASLDDVRRLPFTDVTDLRDGYPLPLLCVPERDAFTLRPEPRASARFWPTPARTWRPLRCKWPAVTNWPA